MNFLAGEGWRNLMGGPPILWPPLFPLLLVAGGWVGIDPLEAGRWINAAAFGLTILAAGGWLRSNLRSRWLALVATAIIAASLPLSDFASRFITDLLLALFTLLALIWLAAFLNRQTAAPLWWAAVFTALAALTRYPGVVLIGTGVLLLLVRRAPPLAVRLKHAVVFGAVPSIPLAGVLAYNRVVHGYMTGGRGGSGQSLSDGLSQVADVFREWVIPPNAVDTFWGWVVYSSGQDILWRAGGLVVAVGVVVVLSGRGLVWGKNKGTDRTASPSSGLGPALPFGVFAVAYLVFIVAVVPFTVEQGVDSRYLLPMYVPVLLAAVLLLDRFLSIEAAGWVTAVQWVLTSLVLLGSLTHLCFSARENLGRTTQALESGYPGYPNDRAYNVADWQHSAILNYVKTNLSDGGTYSNDHYLIWFADRTTVVRKHRDLPDYLRNWTRRARGWVKRGKDEVLIVWFKDSYHGYYDYNDLDLRFLPGVEVLAESPDGVVFRATAAVAAEPFDEARLRAQKKRYQERYIEQLLAQAGERVVRSGWDVYRNGRKLTYVKKPCAPADVQAKFVLHVIPTDPADLPAHRKRYGSENLGFYFDLLSVQRGFRLGDQCIAIAHLPDYPIDRIYIGQWIAKEDRTLWEAEFSPRR